MVRRERGTAGVCSALLQQSIDISCPLGSQQQTCSSSVRRFNGQTEN